MSEITALSNRDDHGNNLKNASLLKLDRAQNGNIETANDQDYFKIYLTAGTKYRFNLFSKNLDGGALDIATAAYFVLYDKDEYLIDMVIGSELNDDLNIYYSPEVSDYYYLEVGGLDDGDTGIYTVSVAVTPDDYSDYPSMAGIIETSRQIDGDIETPYDQDFFKVYLESGKKYQLDLLGTNSGAGTLNVGDVAYFGFYDNNGYLIDSANGGYLSYDPRLYYAPEFSGDYYIEVSGLGDGETGTYTLSTAIIADDYGDYRSGAGELTIGDPVLGRFEIAGDSDYFKVYLNAGMTYIFDLLGANSGSGTAGSAHVQTYFWLLDASGYTISYAYSNLNYESHLVYTPYTSDYYYLQVGESSNKAGTYTLSSTTLNHAPTGRVYISGFPKQGEILTVSNTLSDTDNLGTISYQWRADGIVIDGASSNRYTLTKNDVGKVMSVVAFYTDGAGVQESVLSNITTPVITNSLNLISRFAHKPVKDILHGETGDDVLSGLNGRDLLIGGAGSDEMTGGRGRDTFAYETVQFNSGDLIAGEFDTIIDRKGSRIDFTHSVEQLLKINGAILAVYPQGRIAVGSYIDKQNNIAFLTGKNQDAIQVDLDNNGQFNPDHDFQIDIIGNANKLFFDAKLDVFILA